MSHSKFFGVWHNPLIVCVCKFHLPGNTFMHFVFVNVFSFPFVSINFVYIVGIFAVSSFELASYNITFIFEIPLYWPFICCVMALLWRNYGCGWGIPLYCLSHVLRPSGHPCQTVLFTFLTQLTNYNLPFSPYRLRGHITTCRRKQLLTRGTHIHIRGREIGEDRCRDCIAC